MSTVPIVYHYVAHYREPVFRALLAIEHEPGIRFVIAAGTSSNIESLRLVDRDALESDYPGCWIPLTNIWLRQHILWQRGLFPFLWRSRPTAIIFLGDFHFVSTWVGALLVRLRGGKVFMWTHGMLRREKGLKRAARLAFYSLAHGLLVYGHRARMLLREAGYPEERVHVIFNSLDHEKQLAVRRELLNYPSEAVRRKMLGFGGRKILLFVGRLDSAKGLDLLFHSLRDIVEKGCDAFLLCVGDGPARRQFEQLTRELGIQDRVRFWGSCYDEEVLGALYYLSDLSVSPGPVGLFAIHSLVYGTPIVINDALDMNGPECEAITDGVTGAFFRNGSVHSLSDTILRALELLKKPGVMESCFRAVDGRYTPSNQAAIISTIVTAAISR